MTVKLSSVRATASKQIAEHEDTEPGEKATVDWLYPQVARSTNLLHEVLEFIHCFSSAPSVKKKIQV